MALSLRAIFLLLLVLLVQASWGNSVPAPATYTFLGPDRAGYTYELLHLALVKTEAESGPFELVVTPPMNEARAYKSMTEGHYPNAIRRFESEPWVLRDDKLRTVPFPVYLGVFSYRVCVVNKQVAKAFAIADDITMLRPFTFGVMSDWRDGAIMQHNGLRVSEGISRKSLYQLVNAGRIDAFCRAAVELNGERILFEDLSAVQLDHAVLLHYPMPFFFSTRADDIKTYRRIERGLALAFTSGELSQLWERYHDKAAIEALLKGRQWIALENPDITQSLPSFGAYLYMFPR